MPIFEYKCKNCGEKFELIQSSYKKEDETCPSCGSASEKQLSVVAKPNTESNGTSVKRNFGGGGCGSGNCGFGGCGL